VFPEKPTRRIDIGYQRGIAQPVARDLAQRRNAGIAAQIGNVVEAERYDGLTPVIITL
jgi:hypothetical protein